MTRRWSHARSQADGMTTEASSAPGMFRSTEPGSRRTWIAGVLAMGMLMPMPALLGQSGGPKGAATNAVQTAESAASAREAQAGAVADDPDAALEQNTQPIPGGGASNAGRDQTRLALPRASRSLNYTVSEGGGPAPVGDRPDVYQIQNGDTLWMLSGQFWGDPWFWPTLWSYNPYIGNAHLIYPGNNLRFTPGSYVRPPGMALDDGRPQSNGEVVVTSTGSASMASATDGVCRPEVPFLEQVGKLSVHTNGFLREQGFAPLGKIVKAPESKSLLTERDLVYVQFNRMSDVQCGDVYTIYRPLLKNVAHPIFRGRNVGSLYRTLGEIEIVDVNDFAATARIRRAFEEIERGALVTEKIENEKTVTIHSVGKELDGYIVESMNYEQTTLGINDVIYIDRGEQDNVAAGDTFYIIRQGDGIEGSWRSGAKDITMPYQIVGRVVVLEPGEYVSQAVITEASGVIEVGDHITTHVD